MDTLLRFGTGSVESYSFNEITQATYDDNFADVRQQGVVVPGKDGTISPYGIGRAPSNGGNIQASYWLRSGEDGGIGQIGVDRDAFKAMTYMGMQRLFKRHQNGVTMWTWAQLSSINMPENVKDVPHLRNRVSLTFQCPDARWYSKANALYYNDGATWADGSLSFPALKLDQSAVSNGSTPTVENLGNAYASAYVRWEGNGSDTFSNPKIERWNQFDEVVDSLLYTKDFAVDDVVEIDARTFTVDSRSLLTRGSAAWLEIPPGVTTLHISGTFAGTANLTIDFWDTWV